MPRFLLPLRYFSLFWIHPSQTVDTINQQVGQALRDLRQQRGWSLDQTAKATGVSKAMLGQIERGESSPTVATLWKIAGGFDTSLSALIEPQQAINSRVRSVATLRQRPTEDEMLIAPLFPYDPQLGFELLELTLLPDYERHSDPHASGVIEHLIVISGTLELLQQGSWLTLEQGSAIRFAADLPHGYRNLSNQPAVCHNLICYPHSGA